MNEEGAMLRANRRAVIHNALTEDLNWPALSPMRVWPETCLAPHRLRLLNGGSHHRNIKYVPLGLIVDGFLLPLPVGRLPGVGKVTGEKLEKLGAKTVRDLREFDLAALDENFGRYGQHLYELAYGIDNSQVIPNRPTKSISAEDTFERDVLLAETEPMIRRLAEKVWSASRKESRIAHTVVLKLKTAKFNVLTRSHTSDSAPTSCEELTTIALRLRDRVALDLQQRFRLVGVGLSKLREPGDVPPQSTLLE